MSVFRLNDRSTATLLILVLSDKQHVLQGGRECACILKMHMGQVNGTKLLSMRTALFLWKLGISTALLQRGIK